MKKTKETQGKSNHVVAANLEKFDKFVTVGPPPSRNPSIYTRKIAKFILDSRLKFPDAILLTCVGSFYEAYFDQAIEVAELLNIKQAKYQFSGHHYPFAGFPVSSLQKHLKTLVNEHGRVVAIAEQVSTDEDLERRIVRIITPGTLSDENLIDNESYNYLLAIHKNELAWLDVSTGSYFHTIHDGGENEVIDQICRIAPKEILISAKSSFCIPPNSKAAKLAILVTKIEPTCDPFLAAEELSAENLIRFYIARNLLPTRLSLQPSYFHTSRHLRLDAEAIEDLEIIRSQNGKSSAGSLLSTISRAITKPGKRLIRDRIINPSRVLAEIEARLDLVEKFVGSRIAIEDVQDRFDDIKDIDYIRLLQRFNLGQGTVYDLVSLARVLRTASSIRSTLETSNIEFPLECHSALEDRISTTLKDCPQICNLTSQTQTEDLSIDEVKDIFSPMAWNVRPNFNKEMSSRHQALKQVTDLGKQLQTKYRASFDCPDLKLQIAPKLGAVLSINKSRKSANLWKSQLDKLNGQKLVENGARVVLTTPEWTKLHASIDRFKHEVIEAENRVLQQLFEQVTAKHISLNASFENLAELDLSQSFATFAVESECVRPSITRENSTVIVNGRHPIAEHALKLSASGSFVPNSIVMDNHDGLAQVITGPNNGGKSTYLRQVAVIHILAQAGSFVPADQAKLGLVHQIFTRFGSFDNIVLGKGTFLIEMEETAKILKSATGMSLVLMDEVGRGTGIEDGLSIAFGVLKYLLEKINCRTLFSTHLPHIGALLLADGNVNGQKKPEVEDYLKVDKLGFFCFGSSKIGSYEENKEEVLHFSHRVRRGLNPESSGIDIAKMVGLPQEVILISKTIKDQIGNLRFELNSPKKKKKEK